MFDINEITNALIYFGPMNVDQIIRKLSMRDIKISKYEVKEALKLLSRMGYVKKSDIVDYWKAR